MRRGLRRVLRRRVLRRVSSLYSCFVGYQNFIIGPSEWSLFVYDNRTEDQVDNDLIEDERDERYEAFSCVEDAQYAFHLETGLPAQHLNVCSDSDSDSDL
jgi:hypothetical protein